MLLTFRTNLTALTSPLFWWNWKLMGSNYSRTFKKPRYVGRCYLSFVWKATPENKLLLLVEYISSIQLRQTSFSYHECLLVLKTNLKTHQKVADIHANMRAAANVLKFYGFFRVKSWIGVWKITRTWKFWEGWLDLNTVPNWFINVLLTIVSLKISPFLSLQAQRLERCFNKLKLWWQTDQRETCI